MLVHQEHVLLAWPPDQILYSLLYHLGPAKSLLHSSVTGNMCRTPHIPWKAPTKQNGKGNQLIFQYTMYKVCVNIYMYN